jgi:putative phosphonate metabolism protein
MSPRYAIYFTPAHGSPWWQFGAHWLGRDECTDTALAQTAVAGIPAPELHQITEYPRRYGFHATLKAPFTLREGATVADVQLGMRALAQNQKPVPLGCMQAYSLENFVALLPVQPPAALANLATLCVTSLDSLRAPLTQQELARRLAKHLNAREQELLMQYGYPYVLERYQLHLTLTGPVAKPMAHAVIDAVADALSHLNQTAPLVLDRLCLFVEPAPGQAFQRVADMELLA